VTAPRPIVTYTAFAIRRISRARCWASSRSCAERLPNGLTGVHPFLLYFSVLIREPPVRGKAQGHLSIYASPGCVNAFFPPVGGRQVFTERG